MLNMWPLGYTLIHLLNDLIAVHIVVCSQESTGAQSNIIAEMTHYCHHRHHWKDCYLFPYK